MILLRRLGGPVFALNPDLIERAESTPDTVVTMVGGNKYVVCEELAELTELILEHRAQIIATAESMSSDAAYNRHLATAGAQAAVTRVHDAAHSVSTVHGPAHSATNSSAGNSSANSVVPIRPMDA